MSYNMTIAIIGWVAIAVSVIFNNAGLAVLGGLFVTQLNTINFGI